MAKVTIQYWAAAKEAAGMATEAVEAETLAEALERLWRSVPSAGREPPAVTPNPVAFGHQVGEMLAAATRPAPWQRRWRH